MINEDKLNFLLSLKGKVRIKMISRDEDFEHNLGVVGTEYDLCFSKSIEIKDTDCPYVISDPSTPELFIDDDDYWWSDYDFIVSYFELIV